MGFVGEAAENGFAGGHFYEAEGGVGEDEEDCIGEPGIVGGQVEAFGEAVVVDEHVDVEVEEVEREGGFAEENQWADGEEPRDRVGAGEAEG